ncbi:YALIA101S13e01354g1_1 [Yarrowia lipolytica]|nr:YALIA101S13e01354g1_1 [Yarrowia lipolytica]VBB78542.1 Hypothetical protein conserved in the Yarrowia clade [Yarrowia lipolytica]
MVVTYYMQKGIRGINGDGIEKCVVFVGLLIYTPLRVIDSTPPPILTTMFIPLLLLSSLVAASDCEDTPINKRGMIQCVMRGVDESKAPSHPVSQIGNAPKAGETQAAPKAPQTPAQAPAQGETPAQANYASKPSVEIGLGVALAMCLLL